MEKRAHKRIETRVPVKYYCENILYSGTVRNLSKNGMYIRTGNLLPCTQCIDLLMPLKEEIAKFHARIVRIVKMNTLDFNIGIMLEKPPQIYSRYLNNF